jgi:large subunit ribosomal protein L25
MEKLELMSEVRADRKRGSLRRARKIGRIPAVVYGESGSEALYLDDRQLRSVLRRISGGAAIVAVNVRGMERHSVIVDYQRDPLSDAIIHVDLHEISMTKKMHANLPVVLVGADECIGVKSENAVLELVSHNLEVKCLPKDLPNGCHVDVSKLHAGESIHVKDLPQLDGVEFTANPDHVIVICASMDKATEENAAEADSAEAEGAAATGAATAKDKEGSKGKS